MSKKYKLTGETKTIQGKSGPVTLHRIRAVATFGDIRKGELGGWIESEQNLSQEGNAWVYEESQVYGNAHVEGNAEIRGNAQVFENAKVSGNAHVYDDVKIYGDARVSGRAWIQGDDVQIYDRAKVDGRANVLGNAKIHGFANIYGESKVCDNTEISGYASVYGEAEVCENARVGGDSLVHDFAKVSGRANVIGHASVYGNARITDSAQVHGNVNISGDARISENVVISGDAVVKDGARVFGNAIITDNAIVEDDSYVYENAKISDEARVAGTAKVHGFARIEESAAIYESARVHGSVCVTDNAQVHGNVNISGDVKINGQQEVYRQDEPSAPSQESSLKGWCWKNYEDCAVLCMPDGNTFVCIDYYTKEVSYNNYNKPTDLFPYQEELELPCGVTAGVEDLREWVINDFRESSLRYLPAEMRPQLSDEPLMKQFASIPQYNMESPETRMEQVREERMQIRLELRVNGFKANSTLVANIEHLNEMTGKRNTLQDIKGLARDTNISAETKEVVGEIVDNLQQQEMKMQAPELPAPAVEPA